MRWNNLKANKCPKCGLSLENCYNTETEMFKCDSCDFRIGVKKFKQIVSSQVDYNISKHYRPDDENPEGGENL